MEEDAPSRPTEAHTYCKSQLPDLKVEGPFDNPAAGPSPRTFELWLQWQA